MSIQVKVPGVLYTKMGGKTTIDVDAGNVDEALRQLEAACPALTPLLRGEDGTLRPKVMIYVNDVHVRLLQGVDTPLRDGDQVYVVPMVMGG